MRIMSSGRTPGVCLRNYRIDMTARQGIANRDTDTEPTHAGETMDAILLVGGFGTRLHPLTKTLPKPLIPLANVPFVEHTVRWLHRAGVDHVILSLHYNADQFMEHFTRYAPDVHVSFAVEETPLGTGGAIKHCEPLLRGDRCFIFNGDIFTSLHLPRMLEAHGACGALATIAMAQVEDPSRFGVIATDADGRIQSFIEKPPREEALGRDINAGIYLFERAMLEVFPEGPCSVERDVFPVLLERGAYLAGYRERAYWTDLGTPEDYLQAHRDILSRRVHVPSRGREVAPGVFVSDGVVVDGRALIRPPLLLGERVRIGPGATVGPGVVLGPDVEIGRDAMVEDSVLWEGACAQASSRIRGCILGRYARVDGTLDHSVCEEGPEPSC